MNESETGKGFSYWRICVKGETLLIELEESIRESWKIIWRRQDGTSEQCGYLDTPDDELTEAQREEADESVSDEFFALINETEAHNGDFIYKLHEDERISREEFYRSWNGNPSPTLP